MNGTICVLGQTITLPVIKNARPMLVAPSIGVTNLCKEIILPMFPQPKSKYRFSRNWFVAGFNWNDYDEVYAWCTNQFGPEPSLANQDAWTRWMHKYGDKIHFRDEKDYVWFMLRWSCD